MRAGERELHASAQRRVHVEVVVLVDSGEDLADLREHGRHALRCRRRRGQEAQRAAGLLEGAVRGEGVQVHEQAEVAAESLHDHEHAGVQRLHAAEAVALRHCPPHVVHHRPRQRARDLGQQPSASPIGPDGPDHPTLAMHSSASSMFGSPLTM